MKHALQEQAFPAAGERRPLVAGINWIRLPVPGPLGHINVWDMPDPAEPTLVDCGVFSPETVALWCEALLPAFEQPIRRIIVTHMHPDHIGCAGWLSSSQGCPLWMTAAEFRGAHALVQAAGTPLPQGLTDFLKAAGWPEEMLAQAALLHGRYGRAISPLPENCVDVRHADQLIMGGRRWSALTGGGHSPDHLALLSDDGEVFIGGDLVLRGIPAVVPVLFDAPDADPLAEWMATLARIASVIGPDTLVLPSHGVPFKAGGEVIRAIRQRHIDKVARVHAGLTNWKRAIDLLGVRQDESIQSLELRTSEMIACLNHLLGQGRIGRDLIDGVYWYRQV